VLRFFSAHGVLGLNARNLLYIKPFNPRKAVAFADDKMKTKAYLTSRGIPAAKVYARIDSREELRIFDFSQLPDACVLKPNYGFGGEGILILNGREGGQFLLQGKKRISNAELYEHIEDILDGKFSVNGLRDTAFFEQILIPDSAFAPFRPAGLPDIRIVVFNLVPVMAMLRIPTSASEGKANVHLGGVGIGIDIAKGVTTHATQYNRILHELPHGGDTAGYPIPQWEELLLVASRIQYLTNIGYLAVDLTIDANHGPMLLEVNARAGLMVQVANLAPLRSRLERVEGLHVGSPEKGVRIAQELFGDVLRKPSAVPDDRTVLSTAERITFTGEGGITIAASAIIVPQEERSVIQEDLLAELLREGIADVADSEERSYRVRFTLGGKKVQTIVRVDVVPGVYRAMIGKRDLQGFLIDPAKLAASAATTVVHDDLRAIDAFLAEADEQLQLLKYLKPTNLLQEIALLEEHPGHNPQFLYPTLPDGLSSLAEKLQGLTPDDSPLGVLLNKKRRELLLRVDILRVRGDAHRFTVASQAIFGSPSAVLMQAAQDAMDRQAFAPPEPEQSLLDAEEVQAMFLTVLGQYGLHNWHVSIRPNVVADCTVGGTAITLRKGARFSRVHVDALIAHEIETHALTAENGSHQPWELLRRGCAGYLDTQEGLAIYSQNRVLPEGHEKRYGPARSALAVAYALRHSFSQTRAYLLSLGYPPSKALTKTIDVKRGLRDTAEPGAFTKGLCYLRGLRAVEQFAAHGNDVRTLFLGKVALEDLQSIQQIPGIQLPLLLPMWLRVTRSLPTKRGRATGGP
jgi:alpha-L-glutamate ligase-like protein/uncharacterized protein (TIGR02421 family)